MAGVSIKEYTKQFLQASLGGWVIQATSVLLVYIFPKSTETASTTGNIARYALAAIAVAVLEPFIELLGRGWTFTWVYWVALVVPCAGSIETMGYGAEESSEYER